MSNKVPVTTTRNEHNILPEAEEQESKSAEIQGRFVAGS
jgi:hypothetical protein